MKASLVLAFLFLVAAAKSTVADQQPMLYRYRDDDGYIRMGVLRKPEGQKPFSIVPSSSDESESSQQNESDDSEINVDDTSAYMHEYSNPFESFDDFDSMHDKSDDDMHAEERLAGIEGEDNSSTENKKYNVYAKGPKPKSKLKPKPKISQKNYQQKNYKQQSHKQKISKSISKSSEEHPVHPPQDSHSSESREHHPRPPPHSSESYEHKPPKHSSESYEHIVKPRPPKHSSEKNCDCKKGKKQVYVYKQPPIVVRPKPTSVLIKSKPIVVQPPPLVVHQPAPKPCNPVIKYKTPNIRIKPVIVKIRKPQPTPCHTTKKSCKKCHRKPVRKCNRCQKKRCECNRHHHHHETIWT